MKKRRAPVLCALGAVLLCCLQSGASVSGECTKQDVGKKTGSQSNNLHKKKKKKKKSSFVCTEHITGSVYAQRHECLYISFSKHLVQDKSCQG